MTWNTPREVHNLSSDFPVAPEMLSVLELWLSSYLTNSKVKFDTKNGFRSKTGSSTIYQETKFLNVRN